MVYVNIYLNICIFRDVTKIYGIGHNYFGAFKGSLALPLLLLLVDENNFPFVDSDFHVGVIVAYLGVSG